MELVLKVSCCGNNTSSNYLVGQDFTVQPLQTFANGKNFQVRTIRKMADSVMKSMKKALSLVPMLSPTIVMIDSACRVVGYASSKIESTFMQLINHGMYAMEKKDKMRISADDDKQLRGARTQGVSSVDSGDDEAKGDDFDAWDRENSVVVFDSNSNA